MKSIVEEMQAPLMPIPFELPTLTTDGAGVPGRSLPTAILARKILINRLWPEIDGNAAAMQVFEAIISNTTTARWWVRAWYAGSAEKVILSQIDTLAHLRQQFYQASAIQPGPEWPGS